VASELTLDGSCSVIGFVCRTPVWVDKTRKRETRDQEVVILSIYCTASWIASKPVFPDETHIMNIPIDASDPSFVLANGCGTSLDPSLLGHLGYA
jgi:hypothetical protein